MAAQSRLWDQMHMNGKDKEAGVYRQEAPLDELLADDAARRLMARDGVEEAPLRALLGAVARHLRDRDA